MSANDLSALKGRQQTALQLCDQKIQQWTAFCNEYNALKEKLETITDKTRHSVMIPVVQSSRNRPPVALVPGIVQHTNEILVLLGDNWFVERSAKEAVDIVHRRLKKCENMLTQLEQEKNQVFSWINFTDKLIEEKNDFVEIVEEFDEKKEREWREEHRRKVKQLKQEEARQRMNQSDSVESSSKTTAPQSDCFEVLNEEANLVEERVFPIKSILKNKGNEERVKTESCSDVESRESKKGCDDVSTFSTAKLAVSKSDRQTEYPLTKSIEKPFTGEIIERIDCQSTTKQQSLTPKIVSKFKKERKK